VKGSGSFAAGVLSGAACSVATRAGGPVADQRFCAEAVVAVAAANTRLAATRPHRVIDADHTHAARAAAPEPLDSGRD
jgi:hypothetical protein